MRSFLLTLVLGFGLFSSYFSDDCRAQTEVTVSWNLSSSPNIIGYYLCWGTNSGVYFATNTCLAAQTNGTITNLQYNVAYYITVAAFSSSAVSPFSSEVIFSNAPAVVVNPTPPSNPSNPSNPTDPPPPPGKSPGQLSPVTVGQTTTNTTIGATNGTTAQTGGSSSSSSNITTAQIWGIPPIINLTVANGQPNLAIAGTVGATVNVQSTTNPAAPFSWTTMTNVTLTNLAPIVSDVIPGQPQDAIDLAYVPALQSSPLPAATPSGNMQFYRIVMPYDYVILASQVLPPKGYTARLIVVNMTGLKDDGCYVSQAGSFVHFCATNEALQLETSGSTIRQIAATMANSLNLDWTTASEFLYTNGMGEILATVVEADPPSSDPVAGTSPPSSSIVINF